MPYNKNTYTTKSLYYIFEFLKNNSEKSFRKHLKDMDYIFDFDCYVAEQFEENMIVSLEFKLTKQGYKDIEFIL